MEPKKSDRAVLVVDKILSTAAFPGMALGKLADRSGSGDAGIGYGLIMSVVGWPITVPAALIFAPVWNAYSRRVDVEGARERINNGRK